MQVLELPWQSSASIVEGTGLILGWKTKIPYATLLLLLLGRFSRV